jgi:hypothetical protein
MTTDVPAGHAHLHHLQAATHHRQVVFALAVLSPRLAPPPRSVTAITV